MSLQAVIKKRFSGFSLDVEFEADGTVIGILGASGSGKSMTLKCISGIETPDEGRIVLNGRVLFDSEKHINLPPQKRKVGYLFQNYALFPNMTVETNIAAGLSGSRGEKNAVVARMIRLFKLEGLEKRYPSQLSGGQQQRVALARILAYEPDVIMLDEPFSALDYYLKEQLQFQVREVLREYTGDVLMVSHSRDEVYRFCKKSIILNHGQVAMKGETRELFGKPENVTAARLTGCKNFSRIRRIGEHEVEALDWELTLQTKEVVAADHVYIGIRAHEFYPACGGVNEFTCEWVDTLCQPFEWDILLRPVNDNDAMNDGDAMNELGAMKDGGAMDDGGAMKDDGTIKAGGAMNELGTMKDDGAIIAEKNAPKRELIWWKVDYKQSDSLKKYKCGERLKLGIAPWDIILLKEG